MCRMLRSKCLFAVAALAAVLVAASCQPAPPLPPPPTVVVYGDSLTMESRIEIQRRLEATRPGWRVVVRAFGGTAQCDWHPRMADDSEALTPKVVMLAFTGNNFTKCSTSREYPGSYRVDADWAVSFWAVRGAAVVFVGTPAWVGDASGAVPDIYREVASARKVEFRSANGSFFDPETGRAAASLPCRPEERAEHGCTDGRIAVRNPDRVHLCPTDTTAAALCPVYSSGAVRYAGVFAAAFDSVAK